MPSHIQPDEMTIAAERGRLITAHGMAVDAEGRKRLEDAFGVEYCRRRYPECYKLTNTGRIAAALDRFRGLIRW